MEVAYTIAALIFIKTGPSPVWNFNKRLKPDQFLAKSPVTSLENQTDLGALKTAGRRRTNLLKYGWIDLSVKG